MNKIKIFLSTPISAFRDEEKYVEYRHLLLSFIQVLREKYEVYSEIEQIRGLSCYDEPGKSAVDDFRRILEADFFMLHHPIRMQTSALIELGYAIAKEKKIIIIANPKELPYLALGLSASLFTVKIVPSSELSKETIDEVLLFLNQCNCQNSEHR